jgi:hypothetical protein
VHRKRGNHTRGAVPRKHHQQIRGPCSDKSKEARFPSRLVNLVHGTPVTPWSVKQQDYLSLREAYTRGKGHVNQGKDLSATHTRRIERLMVRRSSRLLMLARPLSRQAPTLVMDAEKPSGGTETRAFQRESKRLLGSERVMVFRPGLGSEIAATVRTAIALGAGATPSALDDVLVLLARRVSHGEDFALIVAAMRRFRESQQVGPLHDPSVGKNSPSHVHQACALLTRGPNLASGSWSRAQLFCRQHVSIATYPETTVSPL